MFQEHASEESTRTLADLLARLQHLDRRVREIERRLTNPEPPRPPESSEEAESA